MGFSTGTRNRHVIGLAAAAIFASAASPAVRAADATQSTQSITRKTFDVAAGSLESALNQFGQQARIMLSYPSALTANRHSAGLRGEYDTQRGLTQLLRGTGVSAVEQTNGSYTLVEDASNVELDDSTVLPVMKVSSTGISAGSYRPPPEANVTRSDIPVIDTPQAINVVPAQVLHDQRPRNLDDALANVSGIVQGNTLAGTQDTLLKRGFGGNRDGSIMHNGMPLVQGRGLNAAADSVEVLKGPASLLYGIMDPGGVVNVVSKQPLLTPYHAVSVLGSTYGHGRNGGGGTVDLTGPIGDSGLAYRLIVDHTNEQYWRNFGEHRETLVAPSLAWYGRDTQIVLSYEYRKFLYPFDRGTALDPKTN